MIHHFLDVGYVPLYQLVATSERWDGIKLIKELFGPGIRAACACENRKLSRHTEL